MKETSQEQELLKALKNSDNWGKASSQLAFKFLEPLLDSKSAADVPKQSLPSMKHISSLLINEALATCESLPKPDSKAQTNGRSSASSKAKSGGDEAVPALLRSATVALRALGNIQLIMKESNGWEMEKSMTNIAAKILDQEMFQDALELLEQIHERLLMAVKEAAVSLDAPPAEVKKAKKTYGRRAKEDNKENEAEEKKGASSKPSISCDFTVPVTASAPQELVVLILVMQLNACRCWIGLEASCEKIVDLARSGDGPNGWLPVLAGYDLAGSRKRADHFFRLMFKAALQFTQGFSSLDLKQVGLHFFTKSEGSSLTTLCEHVLRCGVQFEKSEEAAGQPALDRLISFYERSFHLMEQLYETSFCTKHQSCCEHYGYILRKSNHLQRSKDVYKLSIQAMKGDEGTLSVEKTVCSLCSFTNIVIVSLEELPGLKKKGDSTQQQRIATYLKKIVELVDYFRDIVDKEKATPAEKHQRALKVYKYVDSCKLAIKKTMDSKDFKTITELMDQYVDLCKEISSLIEVGLDYEKLAKVPKESARFQQGLKVVIEQNEHLAQLVFDGSRPETFKESDKFLNTAMDIIMKAPLELLEEAKWISTSYYNMGVALFQKKHFAVAALPLRSACDLALLLPTPPAKRWEILALALQEAKNLEGAARALGEGIALLASQSPSEAALQDDKAPKLLGLLEKISQIYTEASASGLELGSFQALLTDNKAAKPSHSQRVLETCAQTLGTNTPASQMLKSELVEAALEDINRKNSPLRAAKMLLEKAKILFVQEDKDAEFEDIKGEVLELTEQPLIKGEEVATRQDAIAKIYCWFTTTGDAGLKEKLLQTWAELFAKVTNREAAALLEDSEETYSHLSMVAEYFSFHGHFLEQRRVYEWMLLVNKHARPPAKGTHDSLLVMINLGHLCYRHFGQDERAQKCFGQVQAVVTNEKNSKMPAELRYLLYLYLGNFFAHQRNFEAAEKYFNQAEETLGDKQGLEFVSVVTSPQGAKKAEYLLRSLHFLLSTPLLLSQGKFGAALKNSKIALSKIKGLADDKTHLRLSQWGLSQLYSDALKSLAEIAELCGNITVADYYYEQGVKFSEATGSQYSSATFVALVAEFEKRRERFDEVEKHHETLKALGKASALVLAKMKGKGKEGAASDSDPLTPQNPDYLTKLLAVASNKTPESRADLKKHLANLPPQVYHLNNPGQLERLYLLAAQQETDSNLRAYYFGLATGLCQRRQMSASIEFKIESSTSPKDNWKELEETYQGEASLDPAKFISSVTDILPAGWMVCCLNLGDDMREVYLTCLRSGEAPQILHKALTSKTRSAKILLEEFEDIIAENKASVSKESTSAVTTKDKKEAWWTKRRSLDERMQALVKDMETILFENFQEIFEAPEEGLEEHIVLVLDKTLQCLPFESMDLLLGRSVSRMPTLSFLRDRLSALPEQQNGSIAIDPSSTFYLLNPGSDLPSTQKTFEKPFKKESTWSGLVAQVPTQEEFVDGLTSHDLFVYCGHGAGEQYIRPDRLDKLGRCAVALLMGCSSGYLRKNGTFDPTGTALHYIYAGCPSFVANLWDVTDKDIDLFTMSLLESWGALSSKDADDAAPSLSKALAETRENAPLKLRYLNGAAPVLYGLPVFCRPVQ